MHEYEFDLIPPAAGTFTTAVALSTFTYLMMEIPELQEQLHNEISRNVGAATPSGEHRKSCALMEATILEILRFISHVPLNLPHYTLQDTSIGPYRIPKDTQVGCARVGCSGVV